MAALALVSEINMGASQRVDATEAIFRVERAQIFPFPYRVREARAVILATNEGIPPDMALRALDGVLSEDPAAAQLLYLRIVQKIRLGEKDHASLALLERAAPGSEWLRHARDMLK